MEPTKDTYIPIDVLRGLKTLTIENGSKLKLQGQNVRFWLIEGLNHVKIDVLKGDVWETYRIYKDEEI